MSKATFDQLRDMSGGKLTQSQVDATNQAISATSQQTVNQMLGVSETKTPSQKGIELICSFEGLRLSAYDDGVGVWTIGYGTTIYPNGIKVKKGDRCSLDQAKQYIQHDLKAFALTVNQNVKQAITQNQFDALLSLTYNIGSQAFKTSTLLRKLNAGDVTGAAEQFEVWVYAGGKKLQGLVNRRAKEKALFLA